MQGKQAEHLLKSPERKEGDEVAGGPRIHKRSHVKFAKQVGNSCIALSCLAAVASADFTPHSNSTAEILGFIQQNWGALESHPSGILCRYLR